MTDERIRYGKRKVLELTRDVSDYTLSLVGAKLRGFRDNELDSEQLDWVLQVRERVPEEVAKVVETNALFTNSFPKQYINAYRERGIDVSHLEE